MKKMLKQISKKCLVFILTFALLVANVSHLGVHGSETEETEPVSEDELESDLDLTDLEDELEWEWVDELTDADFLEGDHEYTEHDFTEAEETELENNADLLESDEDSEGEDSDDDFPFDCIDDVCYWMADIDDIHDEYVIPFIQEDEDTIYIPVEEFQLAHPRLAISSFEEEIVGSLRIPEGVTWNTNHFNRSGNIIISPGSSLVIPATDGNGNDTIITGVIYVESGGRLIMEGGVIQYSDVLADSIGISIFLPGNQSRFEMHDGLILGRVRIGSNSTNTGGIFDFHSGVIDSGEFVAGRDDFNINTNSLSSGVRNNTGAVDIGAIIHQSGVTGALGNNSRGTFNMTGGVLTGSRNRGVNGGGRNVSIKISGGSIENNQGNLGGAIRARFFANVVMDAPDPNNPPRIRNNIATTDYVANPNYGGSGGGVGLSYGASFVMTGGYIYENKSDYFHGGGVSLFSSAGQGSNGATFTMLGGEMHSNTALVHGGGISATGTNASVTLGGDAIVRNNRSLIGDGGGIRVSGSNILTLSGDAVILDNVALADEEAATRAYNTFRTNSEILHARISQSGVIHPALAANVANAGNAGNGGGVSVAGSSVFMMETGGVEGNIADRHGGGMSVDATALFIAESGRIVNNHTRLDGGGIWSGAYDYEAPLLPDAYGNLDISEEITFADNSAGNGSFVPPENWEVTQIRGTGTSPIIEAHQVHQLNNFDVNFNFLERDARLNREEVSIPVGQNEQLRSTITTVSHVASISPLTSRLIRTEWSSSHENVATVSNRGIVRARSVGRTIITKTTIVGRRTHVRTAIVDVTPIGVRNVSITTFPSPLRVGRTRSLQANIMPRNATNGRVTWHPSNGNATVDRNGNVRGVSPGLVTITVRTVDGRWEARTHILITPIPVTGVSISGPTHDMMDGNNRNLQANVRPSNATNSNVRWSSDNESVATVDRTSGRVTATGPGWVTIRVRTLDGNHRAHRRIRVQRRNVRSVSISTQPRDMIHRNRRQLRANVIPNNATDTRVRWRSLNRDVLRVNRRTGRVTARGVGTAQIEVRTLCGNHRARQTIRVRRRSVSRIVLPETVRITAGQRWNIPSDAVRPANATDRRITVVTDNPNVARVTPRGIRGYAPGRTTVTVRSSSNRGVYRRITIIVERRDDPLNQQMLWMANSAYEEGRNNQINHSRNRIRQNGWIHRTTRNDRGAGFHMRVYRRPVGNRFDYTFAFRGTVGPLLVSPGWRNNVRQVALNGQGQIEIADAHVRNIIGQRGLENIRYIHFTGHSLGGYLSQWMQSEVVAGSLNVRGRQSAATTFNAPGFSRSILNNNSEHTQRVIRRINQNNLGGSVTTNHNRTIRNYRIAHRSGSLRTIDPVSLIGTNFGRRIQIRSVNGHIWPYLSAHGILQFFDVIRDRGRIR